MKKQYVFTVREKNRFLEINGKPVRTPAQFKIYEDEIIKYETAMKLNGIVNYEYVEYYLEQNSTNTITSIKVEDKKIKPITAPTKRGKRKKTTLEKLSE